MCGVNKRNFDKIEIKKLIYEKLLFKELIIITIFF